MTTDKTAELKTVFDATLAALVYFATAHRDADKSNDHDAIEQAQDAIQQDPLSVRVRDGWRDIGAESDGPEEFEILLSTGGPASRIRGTLDQYGEPETFHIEVQDWFTPWTGFVFPGEQGDLIRQWYLSQFYFGEN